MKKLITLPMVVLLLTAFFAADVFAQAARGRDRHGNQYNRSTQARHKSGTGNRGRNNDSLAPHKNQQSPGIELTDNVRQSLATMREEEKLARDVYLAMHEHWGERVFFNISQAESQHMTALANLLTRFAIPDPVADDARGKFTEVRFQELYSTLVETGSSSLSDALKVALKIEEMDIADLRIAIQGTNDPNIKRVLENLERGSRNHLRVFANRLGAVGGTYVATNLTQTEFDRIASLEQERGGGQGNKGNGKGNRRGKRKGRGNNNRR